MSRHSRVSEEGLALGHAAAAMCAYGRKVLAQKGLGSVAAPGLRDGMCASCACKPGTVPNGCFQTQMDLLKSVVEGEPFLCHAPKDGRMCAGWAGYRAAHVALPLPADAVEMAMDWTYSPPDEERKPPNQDEPQLAQGETK